MWDVTLVVLKRSPISTLELVLDIISFSVVEDLLISNEWVNSFLQGSRGIFCPQKIFDKNAALKIHAWILFYAAF